MQNKINGATAVYGLIGNPVEHSFSPLIHNTLAAGTGENLLYAAFPVKDAQHVEAALRGAAALGIRGMNVTAPYKSAVIPFLLDVEPGARAIGAVNTLVSVRDESGAIRGYKGYNTDYLGLQRALEEMGITLPSMNVILIGAGGAARAAGFMCGAAGVGRLAILNRTREKAKALAEELQKEFPSMEIRTRDLSDAVREASCPGKVLAVQCTSVGLGSADAVPIKDSAFYDKISAAYECIYHPEETGFLKLVHAAGKPGRNGLDMLLWQGILAFQLWTGKTPGKELVDEVRTKLGTFVRERSAG